MSGTAAGSPTIRPRRGARYLLLRHEVAGDGARAEYDAQIHAPDASWSYRAVLTSDGEADLSARADAAPEPLQTTLHTIARAVARGARKRAADSLPAWPRRVLRWKGPGRGG